MTTTSDLARELGAIASGEAWRNTREWNDKEQTQRFATGLTSLIDERIAAAVGSTVMPVKTIRAVHVGDTVRRVGEAGAAVVYEVVEHDAVDRTALLQGPGVWSGNWVPTADLRDPKRWEFVCAVDAPKAPAAAPGQPEPYRVPTPVNVGDTFLHMIANHDHGEAGDVSIVATSHWDGWWLLMDDGLGFAATESELLDSGEFQRVPAGYVLPAAVEWHAATVRLIAAYRASLADPETGLRGAHECLQQMAKMAGLEVPA